MFGANSDVNTVVRNDLKYPVRTRYVRVIKYVTSRYLSFRCEFYGCPIPSDGMLPTLAPPRTDVPTDKPSSTGMITQTSTNVSTDKPSSTGMATQTSTNVSTNKPSSTAMTTQTTTNVPTDKPSLTGMMRIEESS